ncbi:MAG: thiamine phosphate synthase [Candidatus Methylomirabilia bacterium]
MAGASSPAPVDFRLYLVTSRHQGRGRSLEESVGECLEAGLRAVQLREKDLPAIELLALARPLRALTRDAGARLFINDRLDVALTVGADGMQRGHTSLPVSAIRFVAGDRLLIGASVHSLAEAQASEREGADFILFGPVYETTSKRQFGPPQGLDALGQTVQAVRLPVFAIGGITPERVRAIALTGAHGVAVISAILDAEQPARATKAFIDALGSA